ncbi:MAG TPA: acyl carrier protein [Rhodopila sp.]|nr:acyl carrier protein [Rhodopila sp.]
MPAVLSEITAILRDVLRDCPPLKPQTRFDDLDSWDSMDLVNLVVEVECRFNVQFDLSEIDRLVTIGDLMALIARKQSLSSVWLQ